MKTRLWMSLAAAAALMTMGTACNEDWGQVDPPAGNQVYPSLQNVSKITFEDEDGNPVMPDSYILQASSTGANPEVVVDPQMKSAVLSTNGGAVLMDNPMTSVKCQKAVSLTMWVKQPMDIDGDGNPVGAQDLKGALVSFVQDQNYLSLSADGTLSYKTDKGSYSHTDPTVMDSLYMSPNEWHFVALAVADDGYSIHIDGKEAGVVSAPEFKEQEIVPMLNQAAQIRLGSTDTAPILVEDLTLFRNQIAEKEWKRPNKGDLSGGGEDTTNYLIFGPDDCIQGWWSIWSPSVNLNGDGVIHYEFINYTIGNNNWENWVLVLTNTGKTPNDSGYGADHELIVLRADAWGWGPKWDGSTVEHDYNWDTFTQDMKEAFVTVDIARTGDQVKMTAVTETKGGQTYHYTVTIPGVEGDLLGSFFTLENAQMKFYADKTFAGQMYAPGQYILGNKDFTNGFWSCWTPMVKMDSSFEKFGFVFTNHSAKGGNWQFWNLVVTNGYQSAPDGERDPDYYEWYYLRCDAWGWGGLYGESIMTQEFDWSTYIEDMDGAESHIFFMHENNELTMHARQFKADGTPLPDYTFVTPGVTLPIGLIFTCEGSWLEFSQVGYFPWYNLDPQ